MERLQFLFSLASAISLLVASMANAQIPTMGGGPSYDLCAPTLCDFMYTPQNADCGVDPNDESQVGIPVVMCPCSPGTLYLTMEATDSSSRVSTYFANTALDFSSKTTSFVMDMTSATNIRFASGSPVKMQFQVRTNQYPVISFTSSPVVSEHFTGITTTVTTTKVTPSTTTTHITETCTHDLPQQTETEECYSGTMIKTACPVTHTTTITPPPCPLTVIKTNVHYVTTHMPCLPASSHAAQLDAREPPPEAAATPNVAGASTTINAVSTSSTTDYSDYFETPYCPDIYGPPTQSTYITGIDTVTKTAHVTNTITDTSVKSTIKTVTPHPLTTTICNCVEKTMTTTPIRIITQHEKAKQIVHTVHKDITLTQTVFPSLPPKRCRSQHMKLAAQPFQPHPNQMLKPVQKKARRQVAKKF